MPMLFDNTKEEEIFRRLPIAVYCKYDEKHVFNSIDESEDHMEQCPKRSDFIRKATQCSERY